MMRSIFGAGVLLLVAAGCSTSETLIDSGFVGDASDAAASGDAAVGRDGGAADGGSCEACGAGESCLRGVCVAGCGAPVEMLDEALSADLLPIANFCRRADADAVVARGGDVVLYDLVQTPASSATTFTISRWTPAEPGGSVSVDEVVSYRVDHLPEWGSATPFAGGFLAVNQSETSLLFGYTVFLGTDSVPGELVRVEIATADTSALTAPGIFAAAWLADDSFVVSGLGLGALSDGHGLYARNSTGAATRVASGLGTWSGSVGVTPEYAIAGGVAGDGSHLVFAVPRSELDAAVTGGLVIDMSTAGTPVLTSDGSSLGSAFRMLLDDRLAVAEYMGPVRVWSTSFSGDEVALSTERTVADGVFSSVHAAGGERFLLRHATGLLLVGPR